MIDYLSCRITLRVGCSTFLVGHDVGGKDALLGLFAINLELTERTKLLILLVAARRWILTRTDPLILVPVHACVH